jgi:hypothetical protein
MNKFSLCVLLSLSSCAASMDDLPAADDYRPSRIQRIQERRLWEPMAPVRRPRLPTKWKLRIEGEPGEFLIPISVAKEFGLKPGQTVSIETARMIAEEMGARYTPEIIEKLEKLK